MIDRSLLLNAINNYGSSFSLVLSEADSLTFNAFLYETPASNTISQSDFIFSNPQNSISNPSFKLIVADLSIIKLISIGSIVKNDYYSFEITNMRNLFLANTLYYSLFSLIRLDFNFSEK